MAQLCQPPASSHFEPEVRGAAYCELCQFPITYYLRGSKRKCRITKAQGGLSLSSTQSGWNKREKVTKNCIYLFILVNHLHRIFQTSSLVFTQHLSLCRLLSTLLRAPARSVKSRFQSESPKKTGSVYLTWRPGHGGWTGASSRGLGDRGPHTLSPSAVHFRGLQYSHPLRSLPFPTQSPPSSWGAEPHAQ